MITMSYLTIDEATMLIDEFMSSQVNEAYTLLDPRDIKALLHSTQLLFESLPWVGSKASPDQAESWPRLIGGEMTEIPDRVKLAMIYQMAPKMTETTEIKQVKGLSEAGVTSYAIDDLSISISPQEMGKERINHISELSPESLSLIRPYLLLGGPCYVNA